MSDNSIIIVQNLTVYYNEKVILDQLSFNVCAGEIFIIAGASGCGKTTLLNAMVGLLQDVSGIILLDGDDIINVNYKIKQKILNKIGVMYQSGALFGSLSLLENVMFPLEELSNIPHDAARIIAISKLKVVGLGDFIEYTPSEISGGMQKRAAIARAMVLDPKIIFLDEPYAGLDPMMAKQIDNLILMLSQILKVSFVVVTHELASIFNIGTRVIMLHNKEIIANESPKHLLKNCDNNIVQKFFNRQA